jgi:AcrR family transcriptional regulator
MPRTIQQLDEIKQARRAEILDAALKVFARRGLEATKITDIAEQAGVSHGLLYHYFPTKEAVFEAIIERSVSDGLTIIDEAERSTPDAWLALERIVDAFLAGLRERTEFNRILAVAVSSEAAPPGIRLVIQQSEDLVLERLIALIDCCERDGRIPPGNADGRALALTALIQGLAIFGAYGGRFATTFPARETVLALLKG